MTPEQALAHPTWDMGGRITIDSATLMNKGLELIEAHHLFGVPYEAIDVVVHPQSIVHAVVHLNDGSSLAHLGYPDMRVPISYALHYPDRVDVPVDTLDLAAVGELTFEPPGHGHLRLPAAGLRGGARPEAPRRACSTRPTRSPFTPSSAGRIGFLDIARVIERALDELPARQVRSFDDLYTADAEARELARQLVEEGVTA